MNELNILYKTAHRLQVIGLKKAIAVFLACKVYIPLDVIALNKKKEELGVKNELTTEMSAKYRANYAFLS